MMRTIVTLALFVAILAKAQGQTAIQAKYLEETELVSVVEHLADVQGYVWDAEEAGVYDYFEDVDKAFTTVSSALAKRVLIMYILACCSAQATMPSISETRTEPTS